MKMRCISESCLFAKYRFCVKYRDTWMNFSGFGMQVVRLLDLTFPSVFNPCEMEFIMSIEAFFPQWQGFIFVTQS